MLWINEYMMALHEAERVRLALLARKGRRKEASPTGSPLSATDKRIPETKLKEATACR